MTNTFVISHGQQKIADWMAKVVRQSGDHTALFDTIGNILVKAAKSRIDRGVDPNEKPWQKSWRAMLDGGVTLRDTSRLYRSITYALKPNNGGVITGTNVEYGPIHQFGGVIKAKSSYLKFKTPSGGFAQMKSVSIPARPYLGISVDDAQEILFEIEEYLSGILTDAAQ